MKVDLDPRQQFSERFAFDSYGLRKRIQWQNLQNQEFESAYKDELIFMNSLLFSLHLE